VPRDLFRRVLEMINDRRRRQGEVRPKIGPTAQTGAQIAADHHRRARLLQLSRRGGGQWDHFCQTAAQHRRMGRLSGECRMTLPKSWIGVGQTIAVGEATGAIIGVSIVSPTGERFSHNGDRRFVAASTVKIPILIELFRQLDTGEQSLGAEHVLREEDKAKGGGVLAQFHDGIGFNGSRECAPDDRLRRNPPHCR
jgi:Beta-lactamase enzyme family